MYQQLVVIIVVVMKAGLVLLQDEVRLERNNVV